MADVVLYSLPECPYCKMAKRYLQSKGIEFYDVNVAENTDAARELFSITGQKGVPVFRIKKKIIIGFDKKALENALK
ncbi:MAG: glutaredoxin family protein [Thermoplasmata archaeon]